MKTTTDDIFTHITSNAVRCIRLAIKEINQGTPEIAVVYFYTGVELLLKARLCKEHWSLVVVNTDTADLDQFIKGDCVTVGLNSAQNRLRKIAKDGIPSDLYNNLDRLRKHRNRAVHFYHPASNNENEKEIIAKELCAAWRPMLNQVKFRWREQFENHIGDLRQIDFEMRQVREYLQFRFEELKPRLNDAAKSGLRLEQCPICEFKSLLEGQSVPPSHEYECSVCDFSRISLRYECLSEECDAIVEIKLYGESSCESCGTDYGIDSLLSKYHKTSKPGDVDESFQAYCNSCEDFKHDDGTMVLVEDGNYHCMNCLHYCDASEIGQCEHCGTKQAGLMDGSGYFGCMLCDGR